MSSPTTSVPLSDSSPYYLDAVCVALSVLIFVAYHIFLMYRMRHHPWLTVIGLNHEARRRWVIGIMLSNEKGRDILAVQSFRNIIMAATLLASTSILLSSAIAALVTSTTAGRVDALIQTIVWGDTTDHLAIIKLLSLIICFLATFFCYMQCIRYLNHLNILVNVPLPRVSPEMSMTKRAIIIGRRHATVEYASYVFRRAMNAFTLGTRGYYVAFPVLMWLFGPLFLLGSMAIIIGVLWSLDSTTLADKKAAGAFLASDEWSVAEDYRLIGVPSEDIDIMHDTSVNDNDGAPLTRNHDSVQLRVI